MAICRCKAGGANVLGPSHCPPPVGELAITESDTKQLAVLDKHDRLLGPCLAAIYRILPPVMGSLSSLVHLTGRVAAETTAGATVAKPVPPFPPLPRKPRVRCHCGKTSSAIPAPAAQTARPAPSGRRT
jgi:hypothetical protein